MTLKWINTIAYVLMVAVNALANLLPIGGNTTGQVSGSYPNLFTPAPYTFSIWGAIYLLMAVFVLYQWEIFDGGTYSAVVRSDIGLWFAISCALNIGWIFLWHNKQIGLSTAAIALMLISLMMIQGRLSQAGGSFFQRMAAKAGFSLYYGWIIAATIANISVWLTKLGWNGFGLSADFWMVAVTLIGTIIACAVIIFGKNRIAGIAVMWAYAGILVRHLSPAYYAGSHPYVIVANVVGEAVMLTAILMPFAVTLFQKYTSMQQSNYLTVRKNRNG